MMNDKTTNRGLTIRVDMDVPKTRRAPSKISYFVRRVLERRGRRRRIPRVYEQQVSAKMIDLTVEHYSNVLVTSTVGLRTLTIS